MEEIEGIQKDRIPVTLVETPSEDHRDERLWAWNRDPYNHATKGP
jgi:hypothetical protein